MWNLSPSGPVGLISPLTDPGQGRAKPHWAPSEQTGRRPGSGTSSSEGWRVRAQVKPR